MRKLAFAVLVAIAALGGHTALADDPHAQCVNAAGSGAPVPEWDQQITAGRFAKTTADNVGARNAGVWCVRGGSGAQTPY